MLDDCKVKDCNPFPNIYCAVTRQRIGGTSTNGFLPNEQMELKDIIDIYTMGSAFNEFKEEFYGITKNICIKSEHYIIFINKCSQVY